MKKITSLIIAFAMILTMLTVPMQVGAEATAFAGGTGISADPYLITNADELKLVSTKVNSDTTFASASYKLMADIDLANAEWTPIGLNTSFSGDFDGNGYTISNVKITVDTPASENLGFFGDVKGVGSDATVTNAAEIKDLTLDTIVIKFTNPGTGTRVKKVGALVGQANNHSLVSSCVVKNVTVATTNKGPSEDHLGGMFGYVHNWATVEKCYVNGAKLTGGHKSSQGGFFGGCSNAAKVDKCYAAEITDATEEFGLWYPCTTFGFGYKSNAYGFSSGTGITNCYSTLCDAEGQFEDNRLEYDSTRTMGVSGVTKEELIDKMVATGAYELMNGENDGYPVLKTTKMFDETSFAGGTGTKADPYQIATAGQLKLAEKRVNAGEVDINFILTADIDYMDQEWIPIGHCTSETKAADGTVSAASNQYAFSGDFNGNNHVIRNLKITNERDTYHYDYVGFFGYTNGDGGNKDKQEIKNLGIENLQIEVYNGNNLTDNSGTRMIALGGFAGKLGATTVSNCYVKNSKVKQLQRYLAFEGVGGFAGLIDGGSVTNCYVHNTELCQAYAQPMGGFVGLARYGCTFTNCYADVEDISASISPTDKTTAVYGFGRNGNASNNNTCNFTVNNMSTLSSVDATGNDSSNVTVDTTYDMAAAAGKTQQDIKEAFASIAGYTTNTSINGGMPSLSSEKVVVVSTHTPNDYVITSVTRGIGAANADKVTVKVRNNTSVAAKVYIAAYDANNVLINACTGDATANTETILADKDISFTRAKYIKVYVWDSSLAPKANIYEGNRADYNLLEPV